MSPDVFSGIDSARLIRRSAAAKLEKECKFSFWFAPSSVVSKYLDGRKKSGECHVLFGGRIVIGPRWQGLVISLSALVLVAIQVVCFTTLPIIASSSSTVGDLIVCHSVHFLFLSTILLTLLTGITNPGIIPRNESSDPLAGADPKTIDTTTGYLIPRYLLLNGVGVRQKYCRTCRIYRPPRSNHCTVCDNCVLRHDHHCLALGTCVGLGNYRWFLLLSAALTLLCPLVFWLTKTQLVELYLSPQASFIDMVTNHFFLIVVLVMSMVGTVAFLLLFVYHYFITSHNLTTNEHLKKYYKTNPFDYGPWVNFKHVVCFPQELLPVTDPMDIEASYRQLGSGNSECISDFYDY